MIPKLKNRNQRQEDSRQNSDDLSEIVGWSFLGFLYKSKKQDLSIFIHRK